MSRQKDRLPVPPPPKELEQGQGEDRGRAGAPPVEEALPAIDQRMFALLRQARARLFPAAAQADGVLATVVVAVSGGADSVTLLHLLKRLRGVWSLHLVVAHLDHGLRPESAADARFVAELAARWELPLETATLPPDALRREGNLEAAARRARYGFLAQVAANHRTDDRCVEVAVAHTANDQAETVLMNLIRGSGLDGLAGMRAARPLFVGDRAAPGVRVARPLLGVSRSEIRQYLRQHTLPWREDPTNRDRKFARNRVRHEILPRLQEINPQIIASLCRTASILAAEAQRADSQTRQALRATRLDEGSEREENGAPCRAPQSRPFAPAKRQIFDLSAFRSLGVADQRAALRAAGLCLGHAPENIGFEATERIRRALSEEDRAGGPYNWFADLALTRAQDAFSLHHRDAAPFVPDHPYLDCSWRARYRARELPVPGEIAVGGWVLRSETLAREAMPRNWAAQLSSWEAYIDADSVARLALSAPRPGQRFEPLGLGGHGKALADYFTDRKVPRFLRRGWPILLDGAYIVWVGGDRIADRARITQRSRAILHLYWQRTA